MTRSDGASATEVAVIGAGVVGLTTAGQLADHGFDVEVIAAEYYPRVVSNLAAGIIFPYAVPSTKLVNETARRSLAWYASMARAGWPVRAQCHYELSVTMGEAVEAILPFSHLFPDFTPLEPDEMPLAYPLGWRFTTYFVDTRIAMRFLYDSCVRKGVRFRRSHLPDREALEALPHTVVVNCSGLGARDLVGDVDVYPIRGQLVYIRPVELGYSVIHGPYYAFPRSHDCVLGGTQEHNVWSTAPRADVTKTILEGNSSLVGSLSERDVIGVRVGLRPFRRGGPRVGVEITGDKLLAHNYGHGGSGWTLAPGCAEVLVAQIEDLLSVPPLEPAHAA